MSIADYSDLMLMAGEYSGRSDTGYMFPRFVGFAETKLNRRLRVRGMETEGTLTTDANGDVALPSGYLEMRRVTDARGMPLELVTPIVGAETHGPYAGTPAGYYIIGSTLTVVPYAVAVLGVIYYTKITPLTATNTTNWLLSDAPLIYLYSVTAEILGWALATGRETEPGKMTAINTALEAEINAYQSLDESRRYSNARVRQRGVIP